MEHILDYQVTGKISRRKNRTIYRGRRHAENREVIITALELSAASSSEIARFRLEYERIRQFKSKGISHIIEIVKDSNSMIFVEEDIRGVPLGEEIKKNGKFDLNRFLKTALSLSETVALLHQNGILHKNLAPSSIHIDPETGDTTIAGFGALSEITKEFSDLYDPEVIQKYLSYISPEQTGRMNRTLDYRTDFYTLGVTFYEMITGHRPFLSDDPMEIIHAHLARPPLSPTRKDPSIPEVVSEIILMMIMKTPEERYQNGFGLSADLKKCLSRLVENKWIASFPIAKQDISTRFLIPQVLYGRDKEKEALVSAFQRVTEETTELMIVSGPSGIGKSALIKEIQKPVMEKRGYFISGKFEEFRRGTPYSAIIQAFLGLVDEVLMESDHRINVWKKNLTEGLGMSRKFMSDLIPRLSLILGQADSPSDTQGTETKSLVYQAFKNFMSVFSKGAHPLVMFLDDLQWVDTASLALIRRLMIDKDIPYFLLILTYRDDEVDESHPLIQTLSKIKKSGTRVNSLAVNPLDVESVTQLISNLLRTTEKAALPLARLIHQKTNGNPFFINQFLKTLYNEKMIVQKAETGWQWDEKAISRMQVTENVVNYMLEKLKVLPDDIQEILKICASVGNRFDLETLAIMLDLSLDQALARLTRVIDEGLVSLCGEEYRFHHDRIQEAAYSLLSGMEKVSMHYRIGRFLLEHTSESELDEKILYITSHLNSGRELQKTPEERYRLAGLNLKAAKKASASGGFETALGYIQNGLRLLPENSWEERYELTLKLYNEAAVSAYRSYNTGEMEKAIGSVITHARDVLDTEKVYEIRLLSYSNQNNFNGAKKAGFEILASLGIHFPEEPERRILEEGYAEIRKHLTAEGVKSLFSLPKMSAPRQLMAMRILSRLIFPLMTISHDLAVLTAFERFKLTRTYGRSHDMDISNASLASILCATFDDIDTGFMLIEETLAHCTSEKSRCALSFFYDGLIRFRREPLRNMLDSLFENYEKSLFQFGDVQTAGLSLSMYGSAFYTGIPLPELEKNFDGKTVMATQMLYPVAVYIFQLYRQQIANLMGNSPNPARLSGKILNVEQVLPLLVDSNAVTLVAITYTHEIMAAFMFEDYAYAVERADLAERYIDIGSAVKEMHVCPIHVFYDSLARIAAYPSMDAEARMKSLEKVRANQEKMKQWALHGPMNFQHKFDLVAAELLALDDDQNAILFFDKAIQGAIKNEYINEAAIASERAAKFLVKRNRVRFARLFMEDAIKYYTLWGAYGKIGDLEKRYPEIASFQETKVSHREEEKNKVFLEKKPAFNLDISSIVKTSQALASEMRLDRLLRNILRFAIENAGAYNGFLILENEADGKLSIFSKGDVDHVEIITPVLVKESDSLSSGIVNYVYKTGESVILNDAQEDIKFAKDSFIIQNKSRSVLCAPMIHKGKIAGILYLENHLATGAFTSERLEPIKVFSTQVAIAIENARLLADREKAARLETEMNIASNIQTALLVHDAVMPGYEVTTFMEPAEDVGGDYYDIIHTPENDWVILGDVSGHGVTAGLVMMMAQTSLQTAIHAFPNAAPSEIITRVNQVITENVKKLGEEKYMTILALVSDRKGSFRFAGLHLDILIYRKKTGRVEAIPTSGIWIGITNDIKGMLTDNVVRLDTGDILLLYTDGVSEARKVKEDASSSPGRPLTEMFGTEKLKEILSSGSSLPTSGIKQRIMESLDGYQRDDDITLLILRQM